MRLWEHADFQKASLASMAAQLLLYGPTRPGRRVVHEGPFAEGVVGVGIWRSFPTALVARDGVNALIPVPAIEVPEIREPLLAAFQAAYSEGEARLLLEPFLSGLRALMVPYPEVRVTSGDGLQGVKSGRVGCPVSWTRGGSPAYGFLTAGHVVGNGSTVTVVRSSLAVQYARDFALSGSTPEQDIAVVETGSVVTSGITGSGVASVLTQIDTLLGSSTGLNDVTGSMDWLYFKNAKGTAKSVYMAEPSVTKGGDSGAAVVLRNAKNLAIGHLIGGSGTLIDYIQDVNDQLADIRSRMSGHSSGLDTIKI
jgi:hypothetical protein